MKQISRASNSPSLRSVIPQAKGVQPLQNEPSENNPRNASSKPDESNIIKGEEKQKRVRRNIRMDIVNPEFAKAQWRGPVYPTPSVPQPNSLQ